MTVASPTGAVFPDDGALVGVPLAVAQQRVYVAVPRHNFAIGYTVIEIVFAKKNMGKTITEPCFLRADGVRYPKTYNLKDIQMVTRLYSDTTL